MLTWIISSISIKFNLAPFLFVDPQILLMIDNKLIHLIVCVCQKKFEKHKFRVLFIIV